MNKMNSFSKVLEFQNGEEVLVNIGLEEVTAIFDTQTTYSSDKRRDMFRVYVGKKTHYVSRLDINKLNR